MPSYAQKLTLLAAVPLIFAVAAIALLVAMQARALAEREIRTLETQLIEAKKAERATGSISYMAAQPPTMSRQSSRSPRFSQQ